MATETPHLFIGLRVSLDPLVHHGSLHVHPDDWAELQDKVYVLAEDLPADPGPDESYHADDTDDNQ